MTDIDDDLPRAMAVWMGNGQASWPQQDDSAVLAEFGDRGPALLNRILTLDADYFESKAWTCISDVQEMLQCASAEFRERHPEVSDEVVRLLEWAYAYANR